MELRKTYTLQQGPSPLAPDAYVTDALGEYRRLLESAPSEPDVQAFLERNPSFVPGALTPAGGSGHDPMYCALITQPVLPGLRGRRPDFLWIAAHSSTWFPTFIEIESPVKRLFRQNGVPTAEFTHARNQLAQWRVWLDDPVNVAKFISEYGVGEQYTKFRNMRPHFILIYGRRAEFEESPELSKQRGALLGAADEVLMSFDRLAPDPILRDAITVQAEGYGRYRVESVTPTFTLGPNRADRLRYLTGLEYAIQSDSRIPEPRRQFLSSRVAYWREWGSRGAHGVVNTGDVE